MPRSAAFARRMGQEPRVAFTSYTTFGNPPGAYVGNLREAVLPHRFVKGT